MSKRTCISDAAQALGRLGGRPRTSDETKVLSGTYRRDRAASRPLPLHAQLGFPTKTALAASWASPAGRRDLREWAHYLPGTRPTSWWYACAPEPHRAGESQLDYLRRLHLLLPGENERLVANAAPPRAVPGST